MHLIRDGSIARRTILIADDGGKRLRHNYRMAYELLQQRIAERLKVIGISERAACLKAGVGVNTVRHMRKRDHSPKIENLVRLAAVLRVPASYLLDAAAEAETEDGNDKMPLRPVSVMTVYVKGAVQAGVWADAIEWDSSDWLPIFVPEEARYPRVERFGLQVRGNSMDRLYPAGSILITVRFADIGRGPEPGDKVVVIRRSETGDQFEATVKVYELDELNRVILWPRSTDPEHQAPIILPAASYEFAGNGHDGDQASHPDLEISSLVIGSYRSE